MTCPVCSESRSEFVEDADGRHIVECLTCGLEYCDPMPSQGELDELYRTYKPPEFDPFIRALNAYNWFNIFHEYGLKIQHKLLDFGCGDNDFVNYINLEGWEGYDPYVSAGCFWNYPGASYDWIVMLGVLEHLPDPVGTVKDLVNFLKPGAHVGFNVITGANSSSTKVRGRLPEHLTYWSESAVNSLCSGCGLRIIVVESLYVPRRASLMIANKNASLEAKKDAYGSGHAVVKVRTPDWLIIAEKI